MNAVPAPQVTQQARLIVAAVVWWTVVAGLIVVGLSARAYVTHVPPTAPPPCVVGPTRECAVLTVNGPSVAYWVAWKQAPGLATMTPVPVPTQDTGRKP